MAQHKAKEPRTLMKTPVSFHVKVMTQAKERNMDATILMEDADVIYKGK
jgi:hypothetical protein